ncbi:MAG TPA: tRNA uridine-5-carboxymethylaminomethyl(34) synthesis GTPase MnmE [Vicinamibacterales bacterium]|nr:tRNA uridine-5-carboxymethylaminomethyl(34) synthesis GTPase MnmE [Vicinamibacterales bacterium]
MFATDDTIVALATPSGRGALGIVRISGPRSQDIVRVIAPARRPLEPRRATLTRLRAHESAGGAVDRVIATYFQAPHSYTGEDVVELCAHGSPVVLRTIVHAAVDAGARLARPGEFTLRAFLAGRIDLVQAEAVRDLIAAATPLQARVAFDQLEGTLTRRIAELDAVLFDLIARLEASLDFPDEGYHFIDVGETRRRIGDVVNGLDVLLADAGRGRLIREGATVVLAGRPNVGKSSLFNALAGTDRAIVTSVPGTTRDLITEPIDIHGIAVTLVDTAGARRAHDVVEREGVARGEQARGVADLIVVVVDLSEPLTEDDRRLLDDTSGRPRLIVANKCDLAPVVALDDAMTVSAATGEGLQALRCAMSRELSGGEPTQESPALTNLRHITLLEEARQSLQGAVNALRASEVPEEFLLTDLHAARTRFDEVVGARSSDDVLAHIFEKFCIGK